MRVIVSASEIIELNTWYVAGLTSSGSNVTNLYIIKMDGTVLSSVGGVHGGTPSVLTQDIRIGKRDGSGNDPMDGDIAFVIYVDGELSEAEIKGYRWNPWASARQFKASYGLKFFLPMGLVDTTGKEMDLSGGKNEGTITGTTTIAEGPPCVAGVFPAPSPIFVSDVAAGAFFFKHRSKVHTRR